MDAADVALRPGEPDGGGSEFNWARSATGILGPDVRSPPTSCAQAVKCAAEDAAADQVV